MFTNGSIFSSSNTGRAAAGLGLVLIMTVSGSACADDVAFGFAGGMGGTDSESAEGIALDASGNVYTTSTFTGSIDLDPDPDNAVAVVDHGDDDIFVSKMDANGDFLRGSGGEDFVTLGDSRIVWVAPTTNDYFIRIRHEQVLRGIGHYVLHLASSQLGTTDTGRLQTGTRHLTLFNGEELVFDGTVEGGIGIFNWDYPNNDASISSFVSSVFFLDGGIPEDTPQTPAFHIHWGIPDIFQPELSVNFSKLRD